MHKRYLTALLSFSFLAFFTSALSFAQAVQISGTVIDSDTKEKLPFVNISVKEAGKGTSTGTDGSFSLSLNPGLHNVVFSIIGYDKLVRIVEVKKDGNKPLVIEMLKVNTNLQTIVISSSKYEQKQEEITTSIEVIKPSLIENKNPTSIDRAIEATPGVTIIDNEPQVRGGSGFSSGLGSRVTILVDDLPLMRADAGRPVWGFIPIENVEQIEVLKGASSVLYGSSALNGAINIRTAFARSKPETKVNLFAGVYSAPKDESMRPWKKGRNPWFSGLSVLHARKLGKEVDFVIGANFFWDKGFVGPEELNYNPVLDSTVLSKKNVGEYEKRGRVNFAVRYMPKKKEGLAIGLAGNFMMQQQGEATFWLNDTTGFYKSFPGSFINFTNFMFYLDPYVTYLNKQNDRHSLKTRYFYSNNLSDRGQNTNSHNIYGEYQYQRLFRKLGFNLVTGVMASYTLANSEVFIGTPDGSTRSTQLNAAMYLQLEKKFFKRLTLLGGARFEYFEINGESAGKPVFRAGANLSVTEGTFIRASFGQGYRFPSIGERYIVTAVGGFGFYPNAGLKPESSYNAEIGFKQMFRIKNFGGFVDLVGFWQEYKNFVEFYAGGWGNNYPGLQQTTILGAGFQFLNTGRARVPGVEITLAGQGKIGKHLEIQLLSGYTYTRPVTLQPDLVVGAYKPFIGLDSVNVTYLNSSSLVNNNKPSGSGVTPDSSIRLLKYRIQHLGKVDIQFNLGNFGKGKFNKMEFGIGFAARFYSGMKNIDQFFIDFDTPGGLGTGIRHYIENNNLNVWVFDMRVSVGYKNRIKAAIIVNNLLNKSYVLRPMNAEAPRSTQLQIMYKL